MMQSFGLDDMFWAAAEVGELVLTAVLVASGRWRKYPAFTSFVALPAIASMLLLPIRRLAPSVYGGVYWTFALLDFLAQLALVIEIARVVMRPTGTWVWDARRRFLTWAAGGTLVAFGLAYLVAPPTPSALDSLELKANLFTSLLVCELVIAVSSASNQLGLGWKNHVMAIGQAFTAYSLVALVVDAVHSYFGTTRFYGNAEYLKSLTYLIALAYWSVQLWREEPARQPISPELRNYIVALHRRVQYDLEEAEQ